MSDVGGEAAKGTAPFQIDKGDHADDDRQNGTAYSSQAHREQRFREKLRGRVDAGDSDQGDGKDVERFFNGIKEIFASIF